MRIIDARGQSCPQPVLMTKKALNEDKAGVEVLVDNQTAVENITRFATNAKYSVTVEEQDADYKLIIK